MDIASEHEIRRRAYDIWIASGMNEGEAEAHWLHAERAVRIEAEAVTNSAAGVAKVKARPVKATKTKAAAVKATAAGTKAAPRRPKAGPVEAVA